MTKDRFGPWVRLRKYVNRCGLVDDWRQEPVVVQLGADGPFEHISQDDLDLITEQEFDDYLNNPLRSKTYGTDTSKECN